MTSTFRNDVVSNMFSEYDEIIGNCILAFIECEKKKREIINAQSIPTQCDAYLCTAFTYAQSNIEMDILFHYLFNSELKKITDGVLKLKNGGKKTKHAKIKRIKSKRRKNKIEGGGRTEISNFKSFISLLILLSLKTFTSNAQGETHLQNIPIFKFENNILDPFNETQMEYFTSKFGALHTQHKIVKKISTENLTNSFHAEFLKSNSKPWPVGLFSQINTDDFHEEVLKNTLSLFNENIYHIHETMGQLCQIFMDKTTDTSPIEIGKKFTQEFNIRKPTHLIRKDEQVKQAKIHLQNIVDSEMEIKRKTMFATAFDYISPYVYTRPTSDMEEPSGTEMTEYSVYEKQEKYNALILKNVPPLEQKLDNDFHNSIWNDIGNMKDKSNEQSNRKIYFQNICDMALRTPLLEYNRTEHNIYFSNFPFHRSLITVMIENVLTYSSQQKNKGTVEDKALIEKQIEMASFLQSIFLKMDKSFEKSITKGHLGKTSLADFFNGLKRDMKSLHEDMKVGLGGFPTDRQQAINDLNVQLERNEITGIQKTTGDIQKEILDNSRKTNMNNLQDTTNYVYDISTMWLWVAVDKTGEYTSNKAYDMFYFLLFLVCPGTLVILGTLYIARKITPWYITDNKSAEVIKPKNEIIYNKQKSPDAINTDAKMLQQKPRSITPQKIKKRGNSLTKKIHSPLLMISTGEEKPLSSSTPDEQPLPSQQPDTSNLIDQPLLPLTLPERPMLLEKTNGRCPNGFTFAPLLAKCIPIQGANASVVKNYTKWFNSTDPNPFQTGKKY